MFPLLFNELNLHPKLAQAIETLGFQELTPIQEQSIPHILIGKDVAGLAQTGTGKTGAFLIPTIDRILKTLDEDTQMERRFSEWNPQSSILVLTPTRELAEQIFEVVQKLTQFSNLRSCVIYGGTGYEKQHESLKANPHFIIATPGRLIDLYKEHLVDFKQVKAIIFDEADRMFDMGFKDDMKYILQRIPRERQFLVFSATLNFDVLNTAYYFGSEPIEINISRDQATAEHVKDSLFHVGQDEKPQHLLSLMKLHQSQQVVVFTNFKNQVDSIAQFLIQNKIPALTLSSLMSQTLRNKVIQNFKSSTSLCVLVATDVAARGLDVQGIDLVINYELPNDSETYVHRIGRTGRAGSEGKAFSLVSDKDVEALSRLQDYLKRKIDVGYLETNELITDFLPYVYQSEGYGQRSKGPRSSEYQPRNGGGGDRGPRYQEGGRGGRDSRSSSRGPRRNDNREEGRSSVGAAASASAADGGQRSNSGRNFNKSHSGGQGSSKNYENGRDRKYSKGPAGEGRNNYKNQKFDKHKKPSHASAKPKAGSVANQKTLIKKISHFFKSIFGS